MASPNKIDRNASSLNRLRRNMQRLTLGAATSTIVLSPTGGLVNTSTGLAILNDPNGGLSTGASGEGIRVDGSTIIINGNDQLGVRLRPPGSIGNGGLLATTTGIEVFLDSFFKGLNVQNTGELIVLLADESIKYDFTINGGIRVATYSTGGLQLTSTGLGNGGLSIKVGSTATNTISTDIGGLEFLSQIRNKVFAAPDGVDGTPSFRLLTSTDIPNVPSSTVTFPPQASTLVFAGPSTGAAATPTFRHLASTDIPNLSSTNLPADIAYTDVANNFTQNQIVRSSTNNDVLELHTAGLTQSTNINAITVYNHFGGGEYIPFFVSKTGAVFSLDACGFGALNGNFQYTLFNGSIDARILMGVMGTLTQTGDLAQFGISADGFSSITMFTSIDSKGNLHVPHVIGSTASPGIAGGTGVGSGGTLILNGTDLSGSLNISTGISPSTSAVILTVTFNKTYAAAPYVVFSPANSTAAALSGVSAIFVNSSTTAFKLTAGTVALAASTQYIWNYHVMG